MRLIDADALIIDLMDAGLDQIQTDDYSEIIQIVERQPTASPWHRVEEPPDMDEYVLAFDGDIVVMASFDGEKWWQHDTYESFTISPSYWMQLPEPPKEEV